MNLPTCISRASFWRSTNARRGTPSPARDHGFAYMGIMRKFNAGRLRKVFVELIDEPERRNVLYQRQSRIHFEKNKAKVVSGILKLLKKEKEN